MGSRQDANIFYRYITGPNYADYYIQYNIKEVSALNGSSNFFLFYSNANYAL